MLACKFCPIFQCLKSHSYLYNFSIEYYKSLFIDIATWWIELHFCIKQLRIDGCMGVLHLFVWNYVIWANMEGFLRDIHKRLAIYLHELNHLTLMLARPNTFWGQLCQEPQAAYNALTNASHFKLNGLLFSVLTLLMVVTVLFLIWSQLYFLDYYQSCLGVR